MFSSVILADAKDGMRMYAENSTPICEAVRATMLLKTE